MSYCERHTVVVTTIVGGTATAYTDMIPHGKIKTIRYVKTDFTNGVDFTITLAETGETVWTDTNVDATETVAPRQPTRHPLCYIAAGEPVEDDIYIANDRIKIVIAQGGDLKVGTFHFLIG
jgi:hypothetical protein